MAQSSFLSAVLARSQRQSCKGPPVLPHFPPLPPVHPQHHPPGLLRELRIKLGERGISPAKPHHIRPIPKSDRTYVRTPPHHVELLHDRVRLQELLQDQRQELPRDPVGFRVIAVPPQSLHGDNLQRGPPERRIPLVTGPRRAGFQSSGLFEATQICCHPRGLLLAREPRPQRIERGQIRIPPPLLGLQVVIVEQAVAFVPQQLVHLARSSFRPLPPLTRFAGPSGFGQDL